MREFGGLLWLLRAIYYKKYLLNKYHVIVMQFDPFN
jgi:hypothetical protein